MVVGLETFKEYFKDFQDCYLIIGGTACDIIIEAAEFTPRATNDIDVILIIEAIGNKQGFVKRFWEFVNDGQYTVQQKDNEKRNCYRFREPKTENFPQQVELFCRVPDVIDLIEGAHLTPIPVEEGLSSLSAILLDEVYYQYVREHTDEKDDVHFANTEALIVLKAFAFLSNTARKEEGQNVNSKDIEKHRNDVFRMTFMLKGDDSFDLPESIKKDMQRFVDSIKKDLPHPDIFKKNGFGTQDMQAVFNQLVKSFGLTK
ncbi:MAG: hypothetical protein ACKO96_31100 [Flammeovirgaceae bacterium]